MKSMKEILEIAGEGYEDLEIEDRWAESKAIMAKLYNVPIEHFNKGRDKAKAKKEEPSPQMDMFTEVIVDPETGQESITIRKTELFDDA